MTKNKINNKVKKQNGFVSLVVIYSVLFFVIVLLGIFASAAAREKSQVNSVSRIKAKYEQNINNVEEVYQNLN